MESHILNSYHQARYRIHGHNRMESTSESYSSESSCTQNSPEYNNKYTPQAQGNESDWEPNQSEEINISQVNEDSNESSDEDLVPEAAESRTMYNQQQEHHYYGHEYVVGDNDDDYEIVVDDEAQNDAPIIQVYAVHPDLNIDGSDEEVELNEEVVVDDTQQDDEDSSDEESNSTDYVVENNHENLDIHIDTPVVSNVDEYFIKDTKQEINENNVPVAYPVVKSIDEYFVKNEIEERKVEEKPPILNIDDFFVKNVKEEKIDEHLNIVGDVPNVDDFFNKVEDRNENQCQEKSLAQFVKSLPTELNTEPDILPHIEKIKRFLLDDIPCPRFQSKAVQRSCSLPHSPAHISRPDIDDSKTSVSFEDLNLDLSDFSFQDEVEEKKLLMKKRKYSFDKYSRTHAYEDVNSFLIKSKKDIEQAFGDGKDKDSDSESDDMELECPLETKIECVSPKPKEVPTKFVPIAQKVSTVLDFCIEKPTPIKKEKVIKVEPEDFVDVESVNDTVIPVLAANNVKSLFEQFEASERMNNDVKIENVEVAKSKISNGLPMRLQDAAVQLNKNKMRHILITPSTNNVVVKKPVLSDHDYCSPKKKQTVPSALKKGQSLLKPEVLSSNNKILSSRHRSCKNKKVVYHLSSDEEGDDKNSKSKNAKQSVKASLVSNHRKKLSSIPNVKSCSGNKSDETVILNSASDNRDNSNCGQTSSGSIKLTIKNKSKVILKIGCDEKKDTQKVIKSNENIKSVDKSSSEGDKQKTDKVVKIIDSAKVDTSSVSNSEKTVVKEEPPQDKEDFYRALFKDKQDIQITMPEPIVVKNEIKFIDIMEKEIIDNPTENKPQKKKLNLQEYKLRKTVNSNTSSRTVSPEAIFPDTIASKKTMTKKVLMKPLIIQKSSLTTPKILFDPIREASRKILANSKKQKAEAMRKRDEDIVMSKIPKVENLQLQPLISDAEMLKIVGMNSSEILPIPVQEKPKSKNHEEIILVSVGTNTDENVFKQLKSKGSSHRCSSPSSNDKLIHFKIKKSENVLKKNVFEPPKKDRKSPVVDKNDRQTSPNINKDAKIDKERYKDITATLKSVGKQVDTKMSSNSLFASIQDVVMKKAPEDKVKQDKKRNEYKSKTSSPEENKHTPNKCNLKTVIIRDYDSKNDHGEDKVILHLEKNRTKPTTSEIIIQTEANSDFVELSKIVFVDNSQSGRKRSASDMSVSSDSSPNSKIDDKRIEENKRKNIKVSSKGKSEDKVRRSHSKDRKSIDRRKTRSQERRKSNDRYRHSSRSYNRISRSRSRRPRKRSRSRSRSRCRSRSLDRHRRQKRSKSPYKKSRRSKTPYRRKNSRSRISERRSKLTRSRSRNRSRTPNKSISHSPKIVHRQPSPRKSPLKKVLTPENKILKSSSPLTPPLRSPTISESSDSSSSSSSSSSSCSSSSSESCKSRSKSRSLRSRSSLSPVRRKYRSYSSENGDSTTPVEERRIVFVGKLEKDITKSALRSLFSKFGPILEVTLHTKEDGCRYGFVTFRCGRDAWNAVEAASTMPQYDVGFGGRRAFCRQRYADLDGIEAEYSESGYHGHSTPVAQRPENMSFEQMLLEMKKKLSQRKNDKRQDDTI